MFKSQNGSAALLGIMVMMFLGIVISGLLPWVTSLSQLAPKNKAALEAEFVAESGAKRAVNEFNKVNLSETSDWKWLNAPTNVTNDPRDANKTYIVRIYASDDPSKTPVVVPSFSSDTTYIIESTGSVDRISKNVSVSISIKGGGSGGGKPPVIPAMAGDAAIYAARSLYLKNGATINGASIASGGDITTGHNLHIANPYGLYENKPLEFPSLSAKDYQNNPGLKGDSVDLNGGTYYLKGNWNINNNATISGNGIIFVNGDIVFPQNVNFTGNVLLISIGDMNASNSNNVNITSGVLISYGNIDAKNSFNLTGAIMAAGDITLKNNANITYSSSVMNGIPTSNGQGQASASVKPGSWVIN